MNSRLASSSAWSASGGGNLRGTAIRGTVGDAISGRDSMSKARARLGSPGRKTNSPVGVCEDEGVPVTLSHTIPDKAPRRRKPTPLPGLEDLRQADPRAV